MIRKVIVSLQLFIVSVLGLMVFAGAKPVFADPCTGGGLLGLPSWYSHLDCVKTSDTDSITGETVTSNTPQIKGLSDVWKIVASVLEMLLRIATLIAIGFVVYGGFTYTLSQGSPDKTKASLMTIINALVGLVISIFAAAIIGFIAGRF